MTQTTLNCIEHFLRIYLWLFFCKDNLRFHIKVWRDLILNMKIFRLIWLYTIPMIWHWGDGHWLEPSVILRQVRRVWGFCDILKSSSKIEFKAAEQAVADWPKYLPALDRVSKLQVTASDCREEAHVCGHSHRTNPPGGQHQVLHLRPGPAGRELLHLGEDGERQAEDVREGSGVWAADLHTDTTTGKWWSKILVMMTFEVEGEKRLEIRIDLWWRLLSH